MPKLPPRNFEMNPVEMLRLMDNVGARAAELLRVAQASRGRATEEMRRRALSYVGECHELGCPPPVELVHALAVIYAPDGESNTTINDANSLRIAGDDPGHLQREYQQRLIASSSGLKANKARGYEEAIEAELLLKSLAAPASVNAVANAAGVSRSTIRRWREQPEYAVRAGLAI